MKAIRVASTAKKTLTAKGAQSKPKTSIVKADSNKQKGKDGSPKTINSTMSFLQYTNAKLGQEKRGAKLHKIVGGKMLGKDTRQEKIALYQDYRKKEKLTPQEAKAFVKICESKSVRSSDPGPMIRDHFREVKEDFLDGWFTKQDVSNILKGYEREYGEAIQDGIRNGENPKNLESWVGIVKWTRAETKKILALSQK